MNRKLIGRRLGEDIKTKVLVKLHMHVRRVLDIARRWIELRETRPRIIQVYRHKQAQDLNQSLEQMHLGVIQELDPSAQNNASPFVATAGPYCRDTTEKIAPRFDSDAACWAYELPERYLINPVLLGIPALLLNHGWTPVDAAADAAVHTVLDVLLEQRAHGLPSWRQAFDARGGVECHDHEGR
jgi:hypothetical protein